MPDLETSLSYCTYCPKLCRHTCPVSNALPKETLVPQAKMASMRLLRIGETPRAAESTASLYGCTGCGACTAFCRHDVKVAEALFTGRAEAEREGQGHPALADLVPRFVARAERAAGELARILAETPIDANHHPRVGFLPGCEAPERSRTALELFRRLGTEPISLLALPRACGGYPLLAAGAEDEFRLHAERTAKALAAYERVVVHCPACAYTMKHAYPRFGVPLAPRVEHSAEFLAPFADALPVVRKERAAYYHDPCYLGRHLGVYDPPRRLLERAVERVHEFSLARDDAACSGGGGLLPITMPEVADEIARERLLEPKEAGVDRVITACGTCKQRLSRDGIEAIDLLELLDRVTRP
jgi:Fe-S oxidoreductase